MYRLYETLLDRDEAQLGIDVKAGNGYFVADPSLHASGVTYQWEGSSDPFDGVEIPAMPKWMLDTLAGAAQAVAAPIGPARGFLSTERVADLRSALSYLDADDRDTWIKVGHALKSSEAPEAFGLWDEWSKTSDKYDPADQRPRWRGFVSKSSIHVESVFHLAQEQGWVNPNSATSPHRGLAGSNTTTTAISSPISGTASEVRNALQQIPAAQPAGSTRHQG